MSLFDGLASLIFGAKDPTPSHYEGDYDLTTRGDGAMWRLRAYRELGEREALRKARAARWRRSWLRRAAGAVRSILRRRDRGRTGPPGAVRLVLEERLAAGGQPAETAGLSTVYEALTHAQLVARGAGQTELADALHALFLLDLTGNLADVAPLVASVRASLQSALGDDPDAVN